MYRNRYSNRNEGCYYKNIPEEEVCFNFRSAIFYVVCSSTISKYYESQFAQKGKKKNFNSCCLCIKMRKNLCKAE